MTSTAAIFVNYRSRRLCEGASRKNMLQLGTDLSKLVASIRVVGQMVETGTARGDVLMEVYDEH